MYGKHIRRSPKVIERLKREEIEDYIADLKKTNKNLTTHDLVIAVRDKYNVLLCDFTVSVILNKHKLGGRLGGKNAH